MTPGWWNPNPHTAHPVYHYVGPEGHTLCRRWRYTRYCGEIETNHDDFAKENCSLCRKYRAQEHQTSLL